MDEELQREALADWLEDRARLLRGFNDFAAIELALCAVSVRERRMMLGGIIACDGQPYPCNGGERIG
jgi:uncharacterized protein YfdQ (DUF2303 family)